MWIDRDPNTNLVLTKVEASNLSVVKLGNSDRVQIGERALAVGFPFQLIQPLLQALLAPKPEA